MKTRTLIPLVITQAAAALLMTHPSTAAVITIHATDNGNGRFAEFQNKGLYPAFEIRLLPAAAGPTIAAGNLNSFGTLKLENAANNGGKLEWFKNGVPDGYVLVPAAIANPFNEPELRFRPKTSGDVKQTTTDDISKALESGNVQEASQLLAEMEAIAYKVHSTSHAVPGPTDLFFQALLKDVVNAAALKLKSSTGSNAALSQFAASTALKLIRHSANYSTQTCYTNLGQGLGRWLEIQDAFALKGKGSKAWGRFAVNDAAAYLSVPAQQQFDSQLLEIIGHLQTNLQKTAGVDGGLESRIKTNLEGKGVDAEIKRKLTGVQACLDLDLSDDEDLQKLRSKSLLEVEEMIDVLQDRFTPKRPR